MWSADRDEMVVRLREQVIDAERRVAELLHERDMLQAEVRRAAMFAAQRESYLLAYADLAGH